MIFGGIGSSLITFVAPMRDSREVGVEYPIVSSVYAGNYIVANFTLVCLMCVRSAARRRDKQYDALTTARTAETASCLHVGTKRSAQFPEKHQ